MVHPIHRLRIGIVALLLGMTSLTGCAAYYPEGWDAEDAYWRDNYAYEPYYAEGYGYYDAYQPAYLFGVESYHRYNGRRFEDLDDRELRANWETSRGHGSRLDWEHAREATRASYNHMAQRAGGSHFEGGHGGGHDGGGRR